MIEDSLGSKIASRHGDLSICLHSEMQSWGDCVPRAPSNTTVQLQRYSHYLISSWSSSSSSPLPCSSASFSRSASYCLPWSFSSSSLSYIRETRSSSSSRSRLCCRARISLSSASSFSSRTRIASSLVIASWSYPKRLNRNLRPLSDLTPVRRPDR